MSQDSDCEHDNKRRRVSESESEIDETLDFLSIPEYATLAQKIIAGGGFGKAQTPGEGDRTYKLHNGLSHFLTAHDDDAISILISVGGSIRFRNMTRWGCQWAVVAY